MLIPVFFDRITKLTKYNYIILTDVFKEQKEKVQKLLYDKLGVKVDLCLQGHGTTNTGNIARKCFSQPELFADCLDLNENFVSNVAKIVIIFKSKEKVDLDKLEKLCLDTYKQHYNLYKWARMNPTTHKILMHGCQIARKFSLPISYYSEDSSEAWHKLNRRNMRDHARQNSRQNRILDVFNYAIYYSDPKISLVHIQNRSKFHKNREISSELQEFFKR